jgi:hypothetical protein
VTPQTQKAQKAPTEKVEILFALTGLIHPRKNKECRDFGGITKEKLSKPEE